MEEDHDHHDRPPPQSTIQAAGYVAEDVVSGLRTQPLLLGLVVLNCIGIAAALWFLNLIAANNAAHLEQIMTINDKQMTKALELCAAATPPHLRNE